MQIKSLDIKNYKAFGRSSDSIPFEIPDNRIFGSGLTIFVGPNNAGKSTTLEVLLKFDDSKRIIEENKRGAELKIKIIDKNDNSKIVSTKDQSSQIVISGDSNFNKDSIEFIPSRRPWNYRFSGPVTTDSYRRLTYQQERQRSVDNQLAGLLDTIHKDRKDDFTSLMRKVIPGFSEWNIKTDREGNYISYSFKDTTIEHGIDLLGDGTINLFAIAAYLLEQNKEKILIIDEPELSLHPEAQRLLFAILKEQSKEKQIILSTHSPYFVDADVLRSIRKFELIQSGPEVRIYTAHDNLKIKEPSVFSFWHRDLFFAKKAIFVEGPVDYVRLRANLLKNDREKAGVMHQMYPLYGKKNKEFFDDFCSTFGIENCFIFDIDYIENDIKEFFDNGIETGSDKKKRWYRENFNKIEIKYEEKKEELKKKKIFIWSKPDITDVVNENGDPLNGMEKEVAEFIEFILNGTSSQKGD